MTKARHSSMLPGSTNWRQGGHHRDIYKYTAISRKVVGKKCPRQTRKVIWDTISVTSWHCSCRTYLWRTVNSKPPTIPFGIVACTFSDNFFRNSCRWAGRPYRLLTPRVVHSLCAGRDYKRQGASLRSEIYEKEPRSTKLWPFVISRFQCTFKHNLKVYVHGKIGRKTTTSSREPQVNDQITQPHESLESLMAIYLSTFFSTFGMDNSGKIRRNHWKKALKNNKLTKLESDLLKTLKIYSSLKSQNFTDACTVGAQTCPPRDTTNVFKFSQLSGAISLLNQNVSRGNGGFSLTGLCKKLKNRGRVYSPWKGRANVCALPATCVVNVHIFLSKLRGFLIIQKEIESDVAFSFPERARFVSMIDRVLLSGKSVEMPSFRSKSGTWVSYDSYLICGTS